MQLALLIGISLTVRAEPARPVLGETDRVELQVVAPDAPADTPIEFWTSVGTVEGVRRGGDGGFRATFRLPRERYPQVALVLVRLGAGVAAQNGWLALPLDSAQPLTLATRPGSKVELRIGPATFGPVRADREGKAKIRARIPPGIRTATVRVRDPYGNVNESEFDLRPPPCQRLRILGSSPSTSWADPVPAQVEIFAVAPDGRAARAADLSIHADRGQLGPLVEVGPGVFRAVYRAPDTAGGTATIAASVAGERAPQKVSFELRPGPLSEIRLLATPAEISGAGEARLEASVRDARGNLVAGAVSFTSDAGAVQPGGPLWATLRVSPEDVRRRSIEIRAVQGTASGTLTIPLRSGPPARASIAFPAAILEGRPTVATVAVEDVAGIPVAGASLEVAAEGASASAARELGGGRYAIQLVGLPGLAPGSGLVRVRAGTTQSEARFSLVRDERPDGVALGLLFGGHSNLAHASAAQLDAEVAVHPGLRELEVLGRVGLVQFAAASSPAPLAGSRTELRGLALALGARMSVPLGARWSAHAALLGGALRSFGTIRLAGGSPDGAGQRTASWGPMAEIALGTSFRLARGRMVGQLKWVTAPARGDLSGNLGGPGFSLGYLFALH